MRVVVTGGAGFIGRAIVAELADRGDEVVALVRDPAKAAHLKRDNVRLLASDLSSQSALTAQMHGAEGMIHAAGSYRIGIKPSERDAMWEANVEVTTRVIDAAVAADVKRIVYVSTVNAFGDTRGETPDESFRRDESQGFLSWYDESKYRAHLAAEERIAGGAPVIIVQPTGVYGPHDHSLASQQLEQAFRGKLGFTAFVDTGVAPVYVDDVASGVVAALDRGRIGEAYILAGAPMLLGDALATVARAGGHKLPRIKMPTRVLRMIAPVNDRVGGLPTMPANLSEVISSSDKVTYWANADKAVAELGFHARPLEQGARDAWGRSP